MDMHPLDRHIRILDALDKSRLFDKFFVKGHAYTRRGMRSQLLRCFTLHEAMKEDR